MTPPFDDAELERYLRRIEARTELRARRSGARRRPAPAAGEPPESCPTPAKSGHATEDDAWLAVAVLRAGRLRTPDLDVYLCRCGLWHITSG
ncbi:hypothetical protein GOARA_065_00270 [Gordonia araii NBRC 100433]|uniref:Uncharacterized protein n=1 Tax=Gordonia araii NBRC 100433 TaxID=1073574 RepID=G7H5V9_9ACTN|nr:hypothetical protein [Gordonia araii]NNG95690.1 hypothetical protein [Gordonia araii NBRC 100433]GAB11234.1 hypothetical protein GOARA_065_00270 [Gordonia araii NBRC 100433]